MMKKYTYVFKHYYGLMLSMLTFMSVVGMSSSYAEVNLVPAAGTPTGASNITYPNVSTANGILNWEWIGGATEDSSIAIGGATFEIRQREVLPVAGTFGAINYTENFVNGTSVYSHAITGLQDGKTYEWEIILRPLDNILWATSPAAVSPQATITFFSGSINLAVNDSTNNTVSLQLSEFVTGENGFIMYVCSAGLNSCLPAAAPFQWNGSNNYTVGYYGGNPLAGNTQYDFYAEAFINGQTISSNVVSTKTKRNLPSPPTYALVGNICPYKADLLYSFANPEQFDSFRILNGNNVGNNVLAVVFNGNSKVTTVDLVPNVAYTLTMEITNETGSTYQSFDTFTTTKVQGPTGPSQVSGPDALTTSSFGFAWINAAQEIACNNKIREVYGIEVDVVNRDGTTEKLNFSAGPNDTYATVSGLKPKSKATVTIKAINYGLGAIGIGYGSNTVIATTLGPPYAPTEVAGVAGVDAFKDAENVIKWKDNADDEEFSIIEIGDGAGGFKFLAQIDKNITSFTHKPVQEGVTYVYRIKSGNKYGDSFYSNVITVTPAFTREPNAPFNLTAVIATGAVNLTWKDDSQNESGFEISRSKDAGLTWEKIGEVGRNVTTYSDKTATSGTKYWYGVRAKNDIGSSDRAIVLVNYVVASGSTRISVFPNPTVDLVNMRVQDGGKGIISLIDQNNRRVLSKTVNFDNGDVSLDMTRFAPGAYQLIIETNDIQESKKIHKN